jgi:PAS domain S-box-containing protein
MIGRYGSSKLKRGREKTKQPKGVAEAQPHCTSPGNRHQESEQWYRLIVENVRDFAIFSADLKGFITSWNPGAERFFGYNEQEILGKPMDILYVEEDRASGVAERERSQAAEKGYSEDERWHLRKDGSRFFVFGMVNAMYDDRGQQCGFIKIARDITPRKDLQNRLTASEELHRLILENIQDFAILTFDQQGAILTWNPGARRTFGYDEEEVRGKKVGFLYTPEDQARGLPERDMAQAIQRGVQAIEQWRVRKDGSRLFITSVLRPILDEGRNLRGFTEVSRDITARQQLQSSLERAREGLEQKVAERTASLTEAVHELEAFSYSLSHDLRAPLRAMQGFSEVVLRRYGGGLPKEGHELLERIASSAERLDGLIKDALSYHRVAREPLRVQPVDLDRLLSAILAEQPELFADDHTLEIEHPLLNVVGHEPSLTQCLFNLLGNALRFVAPDRRPRVRIRTEPIGDQVRIWVEDNGIGIPAQDQDRIWKMFIRLNPEQYSGTGIGLAIVRKAVERMGGSAGVESEPGVGSKFWLQLPAAEPVARDETAG